MQLNNYGFLKKDYNLALKGNVYYGQVNGYYTTLLFDEASGHFTIRIGASRADVDSKLNSKLQSLIDGRVVRKAYQSVKTIVIEGKNTLLSGKLKKRLSFALEELTDYLDENDYETGCFALGIDDGTLSLVKVNLEYHYLCAEARNHMSGQLAEYQREIDERSENVVLGILGALGGAIIGAVVYFLVSLLGIWAWLAAMVVYFLTFKGYEKFAGKIGFFGALISFVMGSIGVIVAIVSDWSWAIFRELRSEIPDLAITEILQDFLPILEYYGIKSNFYFDFFVWGGLSLLVGIVTIVQLYREVKNRYRIEELD
ncbi:MAG: hypothetical protein Q4D91_10960 [Lautropia sp.]|nr:hypothetical protein [Lautropia sp.]